jgi:hypothetical protein
VDLEAYPDYLGIVGGEDKMMDLGTIQGKIDNEEYRSMDEFQVSQDIHPIDFADRTVGSRDDCNCRQNLQSSWYDPS